MGYVFPFVFTFIGISNVAEKGVVPDSVIWSFYIGAVCHLYHIEGKGVESAGV